jgi:hypothetical protein
MEFVYLRSSVSRLQKSSRSTQSSKSIDLRVRFKFLSVYEPGSLLLNSRTANLTPFLPIGFTPLILQNNPRIKQDPRKPYLPPLITFDNTHKPTSSPTLVSKTLRPIFSHFFDRTRIPTTKTHTTSLEGDLRQKHKSLTTSERHRTTSNLSSLSRTKGYYHDQKHTGVDIGAHLPDR